VTIARRNGRKLRTFLRNQVKTSNLKRIRAFMKMYSENTPLLDGKGASEQKYEKYEKQLDELGGAMEQIVERLQQDKSLVRVERDAIGAFVIFEYPEAARRCIEDYHLMNVKSWFRYPKPLLFRNRRLYVKRAPDPEDVWVSGATAMAL
jgi:hypothetical protein